MTLSPLKQESVNATTVVTALEKVLNDTYTFYKAAHYHHWNVEGTQFVALHTLFEEQYRDAFEALDEIAERIRALGAYVENVQPSINTSTVDGADANARAEAMVRQLVTLAESVITSAKEALSVAGDADDSVSEDLLIGRVAVHEKQIWILKSLTK